MRRGSTGLGARLEDPAKTFRRFIKFLARRKARFITIQRALEWSPQPQGIRRPTWAWGLPTVRQFAR